MSLSRHRTLVLHNMNQQKLPVITEIAILNIKDGLSEEFEKTFSIARNIISSMQGFITCELLKCIEEADKFLLIVRWRNLEDHTIGFRESAGYQEWKKLLHHYYDPFPTVEHYL